MIFSKISEKNRHLKKLNIFPANIFVTSPDILQNAIKNIQDDLVKQHDYFKEIGKHLEAKRLKERTEFDLEMIRELGYCSGIENYSRYIDGREPGTRPFCLLDYFPDDYLMIVDESHVTLSQVHAMYGGDRSRKENLGRMAQILQTKTRTHRAEIRLSRPPSSLSRHCDANSVIWS